MTGLLTDLMHERADDLGAPDLDLAEITRDGDRRLRSRRTALVGGIAAAAAVVTLAAPSLVPGGDGDRVRRDQAADGTAGDPQPLSWVTGSTVHRAGLPDVHLGVDVRAWVWVGDDIAFTDAEHRVRLWTGDALDVVGRTGAIRPDGVELVADGTRFGWIDEERDFTVYDAATREAWSAQAERGAGMPVEVTALDGPTIYGTDARGTIAYTLGARRVEVLPGDLGAVMDAENGTTVREGGPGNRAILARDDEMVRLSTRQFANLSPDGALVAIENDDVGEVVDATTGEARPFDHGHEWAIGYQWLDESTLAVMAFDGIEEDAAASAWLLTCDGRSGACDGPGTAIPAGFGEFQLPIGIAFAE